MKTLAIIIISGVGVLLGAMELRGQVSSSGKQMETSKSEVVPPVAAPPAEWQLQVEKPWSAKPNFTLESEGVRMDLAPGKYYQAQPTEEPRFIATLPEGDWWLGRWRFDALETEQRSGLRDASGVIDWNEILVIEAVKVRYRLKGELKVQAIKSVRKLSKTEAEIDFGEGPVILRLTKGFLVMEIPNRDDKEARRSSWIYFRKVE